MIAADRHEEVHYQSPTRVFVSQSFANITPMTLQARAFFVKHHANGDPNHPIVELEMREVIFSLQQCRLLSWRNFFDVRDLLTTRSRRYRTGINFAFSWFGQFCKSALLTEGTRS